jgi:hypothetical protein
MALPRNPTNPEFYVYRLEVARIPFYVGVGRSTRASDRVRYIRSVMARAERGEPVKWSLSGSVVAELLRCGHEVSVAFVVRDLVRTEALERERAEISRLLKKGEVLANIQHNPQRPGSASEVIQALEARLGDARA